jgi:hypothetical protein
MEPMPTATNTHITTTTTPPTPSRRAMFGAAAALLAGGALAATTAHGAPASADADLLRLGRELDQAAAIEAEAFERGGESDAGDVAAGYTGDIVHEIEFLTATTLLAGIKVKLRAIRWCFCDEPITAEELSGGPEPATDMRILAGLLNDLSTIGAGAGA